MPESNPSADPFDDSASAPAADDPFADGGEPFAQTMLENVTWEEPAVEADAASDRSGLPAYTWVFVLLGSILILRFLFLRLRATGQSEVAAQR